MRRAAGRAELGSALVRPPYAWPFGPWAALSRLGSHLPKFLMDRVMSVEHRLHILQKEADRDPERG